MLTYLTEDTMPTTVGQITQAELRQLIEATVERKIVELPGDPDKGLTVRKSVRNRLVRQKKSVAAGERGEPLEQVAKRCQGFGNENLS